MEIHVQLAGIKLGPYSEKQVRDYLADGLLSAGDPARLEGSDEWKPVEEILGAVRAEEAAPAKPPVKPISEEIAVKPDVIPEAPLPQAESVEKEKVEPKAEAKEEVKSPPPTASLPAVALKNEPTPLSMPLVVKSLAKKNNPTTKTTPGLVSLAPLTKAAESPALVLSPPLKVLTKKPEPEAKSKIRPIRTIPSIAKTGSIEGGANPEKVPQTPGALLPAPILVVGKKPEGGVKITLSPPTPSTPVVEAAVTEPPVEKKIPPAEDKPISLEQFTRQLAPPEAAPQPTVSPVPAAAPETKIVSKPVAPATKPVEPTTPAPSPKTSPVEKPVVEKAPVEKAPAEKSVVTRAPKIKRDLWLKALGAGVAVIGLGLFLYFYFSSSYRDADSLRNAMSNGNQTQLESMIDFPALRASLKQQFHNQLAQMGTKDSGGNSSKGASALLSTIDHSIDFYVTPAGLAGLVTSPGGVAPDSQTQAIVPDVAAKILSDFNNQGIKTESLASIDDFIIDMETVRLHLQFYGTGWKLNRIELLTDLSLASPPKTTAESTPTPPPPGPPVTLPSASVPDSAPPAPAPAPPLPTTPAPAPAIPSAPAPATPAVPQVTPTPPTTDTNPPLARPVIATYLDESQDEYKKGDWDGAIAAASQALAIDAKNSVAYANRGWAKQGKGDQAGALADFTQALTIDPTLAMVDYARGVTKAALRDPDGAMADFTKAIQLDPKQGAAYFERGKIRALKNDNAGALDDFTQSLALDPNQAPVYNNRGYVKEAQKDLSGAIADYTQALTINPKMAGTLFNRGRARQVQGDFDGAIGDFTQALALDPKMIRTYYNRGDAKSAKRDWDGAIADYNQVMTLDPGNALAYCQRGIAREAKNDIPGAMADFTQAVALDAKLGMAYYYRALLRERNDDLDGAITDNSRAIELDPNQAQAYYNRGFAWLSKGNPDAANTDLQKFCQLAPHDPYADHARLYLWMIARSQNRTEEEANHALGDAVQNNWNASADDYVTKLAGFLLGRMSEAEVIAAAISSDPKTDQTQHCEAWYFTGMKRLLSGDRDAARDHFQHCVDTNQKEFCEYILAKAELQVLQSTAKVQAAGP